MQNVSRDKADQYIYLQKPFSHCTCHTELVHVKCNIESTRHAPRRLLSALHEEGTKMTKLRQYQTYMKAPKRKTGLLPRHLSCA